MTPLTINPGVLAEPVEQTSGQIAYLYRWATRSANDAPVAIGVIATVRWMTGRRGAGPMTDRPTPDTPLAVRSEYAYALAAARRPGTGSTSRRAAGAALVLAIASGDLGQVPALLEMIGPTAPFESSITYPCAA